MNTFDSGQVKVLIYRDKVEDIWYGTALEFNLTIDGDDKSTVLLELDRSIKEYVQSARELNAAELLNQEPDPELLTLWQTQIENKPSSVASPYAPLFAGSTALAYA